MKCSKCGFLVLAELKFTPIGSKNDYSFEEWKSDHIDDYAKYAIEEEKK